MNPTVSASFVCLFAVAGALHAEQPAGLPTVTVRLYNLVEADPEQITQATGEASELFARAGVSVAWANCAGAAPERLCNVAEGPSVVNLRLMPARLAPPGLPRNIFGFALMSTTGGFARTANVYVDSVSAIADGRKYRLPYVLGAMMAHEIGHLLLGQGSHSKHGLMSLLGAQGP